VRKAASASRPIVLICRSGRRSATPGCLEEAGFERYLQVAHGFEGDSMIAITQLAQRLALRGPALGADLIPIGFQGHYYEHHPRFHEAEHKRVSGLLMQFSV